MSIEPGAIGTRTPRAGAAAMLRNAVLWAGIAALPVAALLLVFDATRPLRSAEADAYASDRERAPEAIAWVSRREAVTHLSGVAAELGGRNLDPSDAKLAQLDSARQAPDALVPGTAFEYLSASRHRLVVHILDRQPLADGIVPANDKLMNIAAASTEKTITFVWGHWLYRAEIEDRGVEDTVAVQKSL